MSKTITLPSGATVKLRDPKTLLMKDRNKVMEIQSKADTQIMQAVALQNGVISVMVVEWSFDLIPPSVRLASLEELTPADFDALASEVDEAVNYMFPSIIETAETINDPKASTANSNA